MSLRARFRERPPRPTRRPRLSLASPTKALAKDRLRKRRARSPLLVHGAPTPVLLKLCGGSLVSSPLTSAHHSGVPRTRERPLRVSENQEKGRRPRGSWSSAHRERRARGSSASRKPSAPDRRAQVGAYKAGQAKMAVGGMSMTMPMYFTNSRKVTLWFEGWESRT